MFRPINGFYVSIAITVFLFSYSTLLLLPGSTLLREPDTFWQIRAGQWILDNAKLPVEDFYSYTALGERWISGQWLSEILFAMAFNIAQWRGVVILTAVCCSAIIVSVCLYLVRTLRFSVAIGWMALTALAITPHYVARPHIFSYIFLVIWVILLLDNYDSGRFRPSTALLFCFLMILWANVHGSFTVGLLLLYIFAGFSCYEKLVQRDYIQCRNILLMPLTVSISALLTPYGVYSTLLVLEVMNMKFVQGHIVEWMPPNFQAYSFYLIYFVAIFSVMIGLGIKLQGPRLAAFIMMMFLGLSHVRGLIMFFLLAPIILARPMILTHTAWLRAAKLVGNQSLESVKASDPVLFYLHKRPFTMPAIASGLAIIVTSYCWHNADIGPPKSISPSGAIDFVKREGITGNVFNSYLFGGYLIFAGIPTFVDGRTPPHSDNFVRRYSNAVNLQDIDDAFRILDEYDVSWVILSPEEPLGRALARSTVWDKVYSDKYAVVLVRR